MVRHYVDMGNAERCREYRKRKKGVQVTLESRVRVLEDWVRGLEARIEALEKPRGTANGVTPNNALAQLRAQIAAVPPTRPERIAAPNPPRMPIQPYGEWEPS